MERQTRLLGKEQPVRPTCQAGIESAPLDWSSAPIFELNEPVVVRIHAACGTEAMDTAGRVRSIGWNKQRWWPVTLTHTRMHAHTPGPVPEKIISRNLFFYHPTRSTGDERLRWIRGESRRKREREKRASVTLSSRSVPLPTDVVMFMRQATSAIGSSPGIQ